MAWNKDRGGPSPKGVKSWNKTNGKPRNRQKSSQQQRQGNSAETTGPVSKSKRDILLQEIISLGGAEDDLDLIEDALSGSEVEDEVDVKRPKPSTQPKKAVADVDENKLLADLKAFLKTDLKVDVKDIEKRVIEVADDEGEQEWESEQEDEADEAGESESEEAGVSDAESADNDVGLMHMDTPHEEAGRFDEPDADEAPRYGKQDEDQVSQMVEQLLKGNTPDDKLAKKLLLEPISQWYLNPLPAVTRNATPTTNESRISDLFQKAEDLHSAEVQKYESSKRLSNADKDFVATILKSGTVTDKVSALTLLIQESPVHTLYYLRHHLVNGMARKKARREAAMAIDAIKDLFLNTLLPNRKLRYFRDQPLASPDITPAHLVSWYYEDALKKSYFEFITLVEDLGRDPLLYIKLKTLQYIHDLLTAKPEQEQNLLALLINKLGDTEKKVASKSAYLLNQLLLQHPNMKFVVVKETERLLFRPNVGERARYYAITFLNQIILSAKESEVAVANKLVEIYFAVFDELGKRKTVAGEKESKRKSKEKKRWRDRDGKGGKAKGGPTGKSKNDVADDAEKVYIAVDGIPSRMMSALLTGLHRAFPFAKLAPEVFTTHTNTLFRLLHSTPFTTSLQALTLLYTLQATSHTLSDRFYRALYDTLLDSRLTTSSKQAMYCNLLYRAVKGDVSEKRVKAFVKRILQVAAVSSASLACALVFLVGEIGKVRKGIWGMIEVPEEHDVEAFKDADQEVEVADEKISAEDKLEIYNWRARDPLYANAQVTCLWELIPLTHHFHPTVQLYAKTLLSSQPIQPPRNATNYDPLQNHTLTRFLERFVQKNPKKVESKDGVVGKGGSLMQPRIVDDRLGKEDEDEMKTRLFSAARKRAVVVVDEEGKRVALDDAPVHQKAMEWLNNPNAVDNVPVDERFFLEFFKGSKALKDKKDKAERTRDVDSDVDAADDLEAADSDEGEMDDDEVWAAMQRSSGFTKDMMDADEDGNEDLALDVEDDDSASDDGDDEIPEDAEDMEKLFSQMDGVLLDGTGSSDVESGADSESEDDMSLWASGEMEASKPEHSDSEADSEVEPIYESVDAFGDGASDSEWTSMLVGDDLDSDIEEEEVESKQPKGKRTRKENRLQQKAKALGYSGKYFEAGKSADIFASLDDFEALVESGMGLDDDDQPQADQVKDSAPERTATTGSKGRKSVKNSAFGGNKRKRGGTEGAGSKRRKSGK
ncbi:CBF/Mak21 family-domain-containing protein [Gaertneriomyces semiglobifer]|nr:CBF/Mak21 family-domain-containing protein [Gaertneriomyces semiglobifer]